MSQQNREWIKHLRKAQSFCKVMTVYNTINSGSRNRNSYPRPWPAISACDIWLPRALLKRVYLRTPTPLVLTSGGWNTYGGRGAFYWNCFLFFDVFRMKMLPHPFSILRYVAAGTRISWMSQERSMLFILFNVIQDFNVWLSNRKIIITFEAQALGDETTKIWHNNNNVTSVVERKSRK